jgi:hypothetical protein
MLAPIPCRSCAPSQDDRMLRLGSLTLDTTRQDAAWVHPVPAANARNRSASSRGRLREM